jgi:signal peptidase I, bacterial type
VTLYSFTVPKHFLDEHYYDQFIESLAIWKLTNDQTYLNTALIKRVIGTGGDEVVITQSREVFVNNNKFVVLNIEEGRYFKDQTYILPDGEIFVLGDNIINSQDSRYIGTIPYKNIVGKAQYVIFPFENFKNIND